MKLSVGTFAFIMLFSFNVFAEPLVNGNGPGNNVEISSEILNLNNISDTSYRQMLHATLKAGGLVYSSPNGHQACTIMITKKWINVYTASDTRDELKRSTTSNIETIKESNDEVKYVSTAYFMFLKTYQVIALVKTVNQVENASAVAINPNGEKIDLCENAQRVQ